jgi:peptidoglycan/xylan/chitin deacetylase (PgdA/CDA1 family)
MRLAAMACALVVVMCVAVFGAMLSQRAPAPVASVPPPQATTDGSVRSAVTTLEERDPVPVAAAPIRPSASLTAPVTASPSPTAAPAPASAAPSATPAPALAAPSAPAAPSTAAAPSAPSAAKAAAPKVAENAPAGAAPAAAPVPAPAPTAAATPRSTTAACPENPNGLGVSRVVEIDTTGGARFGFESPYDFLREGEVVLTFDDGPWPDRTQAVLKALAAHCTKAIFFPIGVHATYHPGILRTVAAAGHAVGSHTWCHQNLSKTKGSCEFRGKKEAVDYDPKDEIEKGVSAVRWAVGGPTAPYFRFPQLKEPPELIAYLGKRNIATFNADLDSFDFKMRKPEQVRQSVMAKLKKSGKGIVLLHDFQHATAEGSMDLLNDLKAGGYRIVFMKPKLPVTTVAQYDEMILKLVGGGGGEARPTSSVIRTINE